VEREPVQRHRERELQRQERELFNATGNVTVWKAPLATPGASYFVRVFVLNSTSSDATPANSAVAMGQVSCLGFLACLTPENGATRVGYMYASSLILFMGTQHTPKRPALLLWWFFLCRRLTPT